MRAQLRPPPGAAAPSGGGERSPLPRRGWRAGAPVARRREGGVGGTVKGGSRCGSPPPCLGGVARGPRPSPPSSPAHPPWVYMLSRACRAAPGAGRGLAGRRWVSLAGGGGGLTVCRTPGGSSGGPRGGGSGEVSLPRSVPPPSPGGHKGRLLRLCPALHAAFLGVPVPLRPSGRR